MAKRTERSSPVDFSFLLDSWPSRLVAREQVADFSGGALNPKTCANWDSLSIGPKVRYRIGGKVVYDVLSLIEFMESRSERLG